MTKTTGTCTCKTCACTCIGTSPATFIKYHEEFKIHKFKNTLPVQYQFPMVCLGCLENKYFPRHLMFGAGKKVTEPSGSAKLARPNYSRTCTTKYMYPVLDI